MEKETTLEVVKKTDEKQERRKYLAGELEKKLIATREEVATKEYPISGGIIAAQALHNFIKNDAQWKFTESLGIMEASRVLSDQITKLKEAQKNGENVQLTLSAVTIEAIYYFMTKEEGKGLGKATLFVNHLLRPISEALNTSKEDRENINQMERDLGTIQDAVMNRVCFEGEDKLLKEIEEELEAELKTK